MKALGALVGIVILLAALKAASSLVVLFLLGAIIAVAFQPIAERLERRGLPPIFSAVVTIAIVLAVVGAMGALLATATGDLAHSMPEYQVEMLKAKRKVLRWLLRRDLDPIATSVRQIDPTAAAGEVMTQTLFSAGDVLGDAFLVLLVAVFIQLEATTMKDKLRVGLGAQRPVDKTLAAIAEVQRYLLVKAFLSILNGILLGGWCWLQGVPNPILWGVLAFLLNFVPIIGSLIAAVPPVLLALLGSGLDDALIVAAGYGAVNLGVDYILEPRLMGRALGLSPLVLLLSMLIWGYVLGPIGALLSVPLTVGVRIMLDYHEDTRWIALLLAAGPAARQARKEHIMSRLQREVPP